MEPLKIIKYALDSTVALVNKGDEPTKALEKVSRELDLNQNYIQRTGESLNVALHFNHFKKNAADKSADFPIADITAVQKAIFGDKEKTKQQKIAEWFPSVPEDIDYNKILANPGFKKKAMEIEATKANFDRFETSVKGQYKKAADYINRIEQELDSIKTEKVSHDVYLEGVFNALVKGFKKEASARSSFHDFETQVFSEYGEKAVPYIDLIYKAAEIVEDRGVHDKDKINYTPSRETQLFGSLLKAAENVSRFQSEVVDAEEYVNSQKMLFKNAGYKLNPDNFECEKKACAELSSEIDQLLEKEAAGPGGNLWMDLYSKYKDVSENSKKKSVAFKNSQLDNRERTTLLQELIMTDPILSKQDPRKIAQAYQQVLRLAPHISKEKEVVRAILRELTAAQSLAVVDANQWIEANTNFMKQHALLKSEHGGDDHHGKDKK